MLTISTSDPVVLLLHRILILTSDPAAVLLLLHRISMTDFNHFCLLSLCVLLILLYAIIVIFDLVLNMIDPFVIKLIAFF